MFRNHRFAAAIVEMFDCVNRDERRRESIQSKRARSLGAAGTGGDRPNHIDSSANRQDLWAASTHWPNDISKGD
jgi:hypothetical protein